MRAHRGQSGVGDAFAKSGLRPHFDGAHVSRKRRVRYNFPFVIKRFLACALERFARFPTMPIYEYRCTSCGHELEALQKLSDAPLTDCPACHGATLSKKVSAAGFQLKGSGWYVTDFRDKGTKKPAKDAAKPADATNGADAKSDKTAPTASKESSTTTSGAAADSKPATTTSTDKA